MHGKGMLAAVDLVILIKPWFLIWIKKFINVNCLTFRTILLLPMQLAAVKNISYIESMIVLNVPRIK